MEIMTEWFESLRSGSRKWEKSITVEGYFNKHIGPSIWKAGLTLNFAPSDHLIIEDLLNDDIRKLIHWEQLYRHIIFGVFDVMLTSPITPITDYKLTIIKVNYSEIESTPTAFRMAARIATRKALEKYYLDGIGP